MLIRISKLFNVKDINGKINAIGVNISNNSNANTAIGTRNVFERIDTSGKVLNKYICTNTSHDSTLSVREIESDKLL